MKKPASRKPNGKPTLRHVAELAGVSASTVSLVMLDKGSIPDGTRTKVKNVIDKVGYKPLRSRRSEIREGPIALIIEDLSNPYYVELFNAVDEFVGDQSLVTILVSTRGSVDRQVSLLKNLKNLGCSGALLIPADGSGAETLDAIATNPDIPVVLGVRHLGFGAFDYVGPNYFLGMQLATRHLLELGHRRIAFIGGLPHNTAYSERLGAFRMSVESFDRGKVQVFEKPGPPTAEFGAAAMGELFELDTRPTAIIGYNDLLSFGVMAAARDRGMAIGRDISVVGFDDIKASARPNISLTTVSTPPSRIGEEMARLLVARFEDPEASPVNIIPPPVLKIRETCGSQMTGKLRTVSTKIDLASMLYWP